MTCGLYNGATAVLPDGTEDLRLGNINSVDTLSLRCDAGEQTAEDITAHAPADCQVSADGVTYGATAVFAAGSVQDTDVPVYYKRTGSSVSDALVQITFTPHIAAVAVEAIPDTTAPVIAGTLTATALSSSQVQLSGPTASDDTGIAKWQYSVDGGAWVDIASTAATMPDTTVSGLSPSTTYAFDVRALDAAGNASDALTDFATTQEAVDTDPPSLSGTLAVVDNGNGTLTLDWTNATDNVGVAGYDVEYGTTNAYGTVVSPDPTASTCVVSGLTLNTLYYFRVRAYDAAGNASDWLTATKTPLGWSDDFSTDKTAYWTDSADGGGAKSITGGQFIINTYSTVAARVMRESVNRVPLNVAGTLTINGVAGTVTPATNTLILLQMFKTAGLTVASTLTGLTVCGVNYRTDSSTVTITYVDTGGVTHYWTGSAWTTTLTSITRAITAGDALQAIMEMNGTQVRWIFKHNGATVATSEWVAITELNGTPDCYVMFRDTSATVGYNMPFNDVTYQVA